MRSIGIVNIAERDDKKRKWEKKQFTKTARFINKISKIKLKWPSKSKSDIETRNLVNMDDDVDSLSAKSASDTYTDTIFNRKQLKHALSEPIRASNSFSAAANKPKKTDRQSKCTINGIVDENGTYHIDQSLFGFQNPHKSKTDAAVYNNSNKKRSALSTITGSSPKFLSYQRNKKKKTPKKYGNGYKANGKINFLEISQQIKGLKKLLSEKKSLSEIISIYHHQYGFCVEFIVYLLTTIDQMCPEYIYVVSRHVDKQIKILHGLSLWQYILRCASL